MESQARLVRQSHFEKHVPGSQRKSRRHNRGERGRQRPRARRAHTGKCSWQQSSGYSPQDDRALIIVYRTSTTGARNLSGKNRKTRIEALEAVAGRTTLIFRSPRNLMERRVELPL